MFWQIIVEKKRSIRHWFRTLGCVFFFFSFFCKWKVNFSWEVEASLPILFDCLLSFFKQLRDSYLSLSTGKSFKEWFWYSRQQWNLANQFRHWRSLKFLHSRNTKLTIFFLKLVTRLWFSYVSIFHLFEKMHLLIWPIRPKYKFSYV